MPRRHLRRYQAPEWWPVSTKEATWVVRPSPGPHPLSKSLPLAILVRDVLRYTKTLREARYVVGNGLIKVDGEIRRDYKYPVGLMDIIEIIPTNEVYRMVPHPTKFLWPVPISQEEAKYKLCRIENKTMVKGGQIQLNLHDGRNLQLPYEEGSKYETLGSVLIDISENKILDYVKLELGSLGLIVDGKNVGYYGKITEIIQTYRKRGSTAKIMTGDGKEVRTIIDYLFVVGKEKPLVTIAQLQEAPTPQ
ncbi:30S ribosomal protein S4e [Vulcanisaeta souniana]|uniref:Small ribosomal subunit protein eS4 n=1 Tax=Vulcanisaeta souniana JCM 11219 TaxID=1293586 RepID=A0A830ECM0_9CREN|nr:30S ribosomal protein S4e [Vulcanisaeta souniana]BDR91628.1 30S ribosomal protein S4e [Vulcanisaeta souniana JCM 11219]GGI71784.1 30S ribosomal protein S4e [Vulcanisaeta souniana JCM 11219]